MNEPNSTDTPKPADTPKAIVIGTGIAGASAAFHLSSLGVATTVVDSGEAGQATAASAGIIQPWASSASGTYYELYAAGAAYYPELLTALEEAGIAPAATSFTRNGALFVDSDESVIESALARVLARQAAGEPLIGEARRLSSAELVAAFPPLNPDLHGLVVPGGGRVDGRVLRDALLEAARATASPSVVRGHATLAPDGTVAIDGTPVQADVVVAAAGTWTNRLLEPLGLRTPVEPQRGQITHLRLPGVDTSSWPTVHRGDHYMVAFDDGRVAVGATRESGSGFDPRVTAAGQAEVLKKALALAPGLADATLLETRVGLRPFPDDNLPLFGRVPGFPHLYLATGFGAGGLTMGPYIGKLTAEAAVAGRDVALGTMEGRLASL